MERGPEARPPVCLRYAMWATAASFSQSYRSVEDLLYKRARQYIEATEMKVSAGSSVLLPGTYIFAESRRTLLDTISCPDLVSNRYV